MAKRHTTTTITTESNSLRMDKQGEVIGSRINQKTSLIDSKSSVSLGRNIILCIFAACALVSFVWRATGSDNIFSFSSFLETLSNVPSIPTSWIKSFVSNTIESDWGLFNFFKEFLNRFIMPLLGVISFFCIGVVQLLTYAIYVVGFLFGVA